MLTNQQLTTLMARAQATPQPMDLYHGTTDQNFFSKICLRQGFSNNSIFMASYSLRSLGGTNIYGPGIYLADTRQEALRYGQLIIRFEFDSTTEFFDLTGVVGTAHAHAVGVPTQRMLAEPRVHALLKVTPHYYVARTPFNCVVGVG